jgi:hypothetical protein
MAVARRLVAGMLVLLCVSGIRPASAEEPTAQEPAKDQDAAHSQYREAYAAIERKDWTLARQLLNKLWSQQQTYDVAGSLAQVEYQLRDFAAAASHMAFAVANLPPKEKPETVERFKTGLAELKELVGTVTIAVNLPGADVRVDGKTVGRSPLDSELFVDVGSHHIEAELEGYQSVSEQFYASAGDELTVKLVLAKSPPHAKGAAGATAPTRSAAPEPSRDSGPQPRQARELHLVTGGVAIAALATSLGFFIASAVKDSKREQLLSGLEGDNPCVVRPGLPGECSTIARLADKAATYRAVGATSLGIGVVAGVATYFLWPAAAPGSASRRNRSPTAELLALPTRSGLALHATVRTSF